jgi:hypothetical protein
MTSEGKRGREYFRKVAELGVQAAAALDCTAKHRDCQLGCDRRFGHLYAAAVAFCEADDRF